MGEITILQDDPSRTELVFLLEQLDLFLNGLYSPEDNYSMSIPELRKPQVTFLAALADGRAVGCGAVVNRDDTYAEVKRMFVLPEYRGRGIASRILLALESEAAEQGLSVVRLETGVRQPEALRLYERAGYHRRGPFGEYPDNGQSVFLEKRFLE